MAPMEVIRRAAVFSLLGLFALATLTACDDESPAAPKDDLTQLKEATSKYASLQAAQQDGYGLPPGSGCVGTPAGAMGVHYVNMSLIGINPQAPVGPDGRVTGSDGKIELLRPEVLLFLPKAGGGQPEFVGVEYQVFESAWKAAGNTAAPKLMGVEFALVKDNPATPFDEAHGFAPYYALHVWSERENPAGLTAPFNPTLSCPSAGAGAGAAHTH